MGKHDERRRIEVMLMRLSCYSISEREYLARAGAISVACSPGQPPRSAEFSATTVAKTSRDGDLFLRTAQPKKPAWHFWGEAERLEQLGISWSTWVVVTVFGLWWLAELAVRVSRTLALLLH